MGHRKRGGAYGRGLESSIAKTVKFVVNAGTALRPLDVAIRFGVTLDTALGWCEIAAERALLARDAEGRVRALEEPKT